MRSLGACFEAALRIAFDRFQRLAKRGPDFSANAAALPSCPRQRMEPVHELTMRCEKAGLHSTQTTDSSCDPARVCKALKRPRPLVSRLCADCEQVPETPEAKAKAHQPRPGFFPVLGDGRKQRAWLGLQRAWPPCLWVSSLRRVCAHDSPSGCWLARLPRPGLNAGLQSHRGLSACSGALRARTPKPGFCRLRAALPAALYFSSPFLAWGARRGSQAAHDSGRPARDESDAAAMMRVISSCHACSAC